MSFFNFDELDQLHVELTNGCNAACPMCVRFHNSSPYTRPELQIQQITLDKWKEWVNPEVMEKLNLVLFCGVHGDPCVARDFLEICEYIAETNPKTKVMVNTNGGMRTADWWRKVGELFAKKRDQDWRITFSIDGLEDTNHLYRRNVKWGKLVENVLAYNKTGAASTWDYLVFRHNEHQVEKAKKLAKVFRFEYFTPKKALGVDNGTSLKGMPALNKEGKLDYWIEAPVNVEYRNLETPVGETEFISHEFDVAQYREQKQAKVQKKGFATRAALVYEEKINMLDLTEHDSCSIYCKSQNKRGNVLKKEVFIDCSGVVMPCCYMATHLNSTYTTTETLQLHNHMNKYGWEKFDLHNHTLKEILDAKHLDTVFANTWNLNSIKEGKTLFCAMTCGRVSDIDRIYTHESVSKKLHNKHNQAIDYHENK